MTNKTIQWAIDNRRKLTYCYALNSTRTNVPKRIDENGQVVMENNIRVDPALLAQSVDTARRLYRKSRGLQEAIIR